MHVGVAVFLSTASCQCLCYCYVLQHHTCHLQVSLFHDSEMGIRCAAGFLSLARLFCAMTSMFACRPLLPLPPPSPYPLSLPPLPPPFPCH